VTGVTVTNGSVYHFAVGVRLDESSGNTISDLNVHDNIGILPSDAANNGDGIALYASNDNLIENNTVRHDGPWDGIATLSSNGSTGTDGASYNTITNNLIVDNSVAMLDNNGQPVWKQDNGVAITGPGSTHNVVDHNVIDGSSVNGVQIFPSCIHSYAGASRGCAGSVANDYNVISNNVVEDNGFGAPAAIAPLGDGILILSMGPRGIFEPGHETVDNNVVKDNQRNGISIGSGNGEDLYNAPGTTQGDNYGCSNLNSGGGNTGVPTANLCGTLYNTVTGNTSSGNGEDGIWIGPKSMFNIVGNNNVSDNRVDGIGIGLAVLYNANSQAVPNGQGGFETIAGTAGTDNTIIANTATGDGVWDGRDDNPGCGNTWVANHFRTVNQPCV
jgi:parallel beta-helix repeat protein